MYFLLAVDLDQGFLVGLSYEKLQVSDDKYSVVLHFVSLMLVFSFWVTTSGIQTAQL